MNFLGNKFLIYAQQMLQDFFPRNEELIKDALESGTTTDPATGKPVLECLLESHNFNSYVNLMYRTAQKSELMVLETYSEKVKYLKLSLSYYTELFKLFMTMSQVLS